jgi:hypothetical protein
MECVIRDSLVLGTVSLSIWFKFVGLCLHEAWMRAGGSFGPFGSASLMLMFALDCSRGEVDLGLSASSQAHPEGSW